MFNEKQIRYCHAQLARINAVRPLLDRYQADHVRYFNAQVADLNSRCGDYRYIGSALADARKWLEANRARIEQDARTAYKRRFPDDELIVRAPGESSPAEPTQPEAPSANPAISQSPAAAAAAGRRDHAPATRTPQEIANLAFRSTVFLILEDANGRPTAIGSGFFVREGHVATNWHVLEHSSAGHVRLAGGKATYPIQGLVAVNERIDLAIVKVASDIGTILPLADSSSVIVGDTIFAAGNPQGLEGTFSQGLISSVREVAGDKYLQITAPISPGSSGGPVLNGAGEVVGIAVGTVRGGQNLNFAIPSNYLRALMQNTGVVKPLRPSTQRQKGLGTRRREHNLDGVAGGSLVWTYEHLETGQYSFSLRNDTQRHIRNVRCAVIFLDRSGEVLETDLIAYDSLIPAGLARRVNDSVHPSVQRLTTNVEVRVLDFDVVN